MEPLVDAFVAAALAPGEHARVAGHLTHCTSCRIAYLKATGAGSPAGGGRPRGPEGGGR
ncbi:zf-HC2 domain-containing protein [Streptomyces sp. NPDC059175]|uniref:zf-HC2 domain-containing protein n=1 Tax=Streptomyces sp. NPDC059175 TaxID=3346757 RepID=UPI0036B0ECFB